ncbi:MAG TPA: HAMP domain-containing sensor histidine kinase [Bacteroidales bacterium]|nr:HAMP domain-containing sensor histidine kinase [Bacteroidales bacterium]
MFNLSPGDSYAEGDSLPRDVKKDKEMNPFSNNALNCPTVLTSMSHEMRTHMNAIVAFSFLMKDDGCSYSDREEFSNQILSSCEQLIGLFDSFLDSAILDTGNSRTENKTCRLDSLLDDLLAEFRDAINEEDSKDIELKTEIQLPGPAEVLIDRNKLFRVIRSLFQNSLKSTCNGYIKVGYHLINDTIRFIIIDSGEGYFKTKEFINSRNLSESLALYNDTYTALNISLAQKIIGIMGGNLRIEKNGSSGTAISFTVPLSVAGNKGDKNNYYVNTMITI